MFFSALGIVGLCIKQVGFFYSLTIVSMWNKTTNECFTQQGALGRF